MDTQTAYHQFGRFIVEFQHLEHSINDLIEHLSGSDNEVVRILINELEYGKRMNTADVLFARFVDVHTNTKHLKKRDFHNLIVECRSLGDRRNDLVHSKFIPWLNVNGAEGLLRQNSKLRGTTGKRERNIEELQPISFSDDLRRLAAASKDLEKFRIEVINCSNPVLDFQ
jgi:hypothetical protein